MALTKEQRIHIETRIDRVVRAQLYEQPAPKMPPAVARAQATVTAWNTAQHNAAKARRQVIEDTAQRVREAVLFGDPSDALKAVQLFESAKFK